MPKAAHLLRPATKAKSTKLHDASAELPGLKVNKGSKTWRMKKPAKSEPFKGPPKVTIAPTPRGRFDPEPGQTFGCGFAAAGMGVDITTGKPWSAK